MGSRQTAWIDADGEVLQGEGLMGITLRNISVEEAKSG
jgi:hypothetical protein